MEQDKIELWTPWEWEEMNHHFVGEEPQGTTIMQVGGHYVCHQLNIRPIEKRQEIAACICLAVNETYGEGINPEAVKKMHEALTDLVERVNRARSILQNPSSPSHGYWGMLDTEAAKVALEKSKL